MDRLTLEGNFTGNLEMLNLNFRLIDHLTIVDTSEVQHITLATINSGVIASSVSAITLPQWFSQYMPAITALIP